MKAPAEAPIPLGYSARSLPEYVADHLGRQISEGKLKAGERLKEIELAQQHAVSRATIRSAFDILERQRLLQRTPRAGVRVADFSMQELTESFEVRAVLLGLAAARVANSVSRERLDEMEALVDKMEQATARGGAVSHAYTKYSLACQNLLVEQSGSALVQTIYQQVTHAGIWDRVRATGIGFRLTEDQREALKDWRSLIAALRQRNAGAAEAAARLVLQHSHRRIAVHAETDDSV